MTITAKTTETFLLIVLATTVTQTHQQKKICQQITIPMCKGIGYNFTHLPNQFNHDSQEEAGLEVHQYWPLVEIKCSLDLRFFICSLYAPICMEDYGGTVTACRSVCLRARAGCEPVMRQYGFLWPERFACSNFPPFGPRSICMDERRGELPPEGETNINNKTLMPSHGVGMETNQKQQSCKKPLVPKPGRELNYGDGGNTILGNCTLPCQLFPSEEAQFGGAFIGFWAVFCLIVSLFTLATFLLDVERFRFPERPIVWLSFCYVFIAIGHLIKFITPHLPSPSLLFSCENGVIMETPPIFHPCFLVFFLIYFFGVASWAWWVNLSISWYLASGLKWSSEAIQKKSNFFHALAWSPAFVLTFLASRHVTGDPVISGVCLVGSTSDSHLLNFMIIPMSTCLAIGAIFLLSGFIELFKIRKVISKETPGIKTEKLEKLMIRIGVFSILYLLPATAVIATQFYEMGARVTMTTSNQKQQSNSSSRMISYEILIIKYFMSLAIGISSGGVWIMSSKTFNSWRGFFYNRIFWCCCRGNNSSSCSCCNDVSKGVNV